MRRKKNDQNNICGVLKIESVPQNSRILLAMQIHDSRMSVSFCACVEVTKDGITSQPTDILSMCIISSFVIYPVSVLQLCCCRPYKTLLAVVILSIRPSVCPSHTCFVTKPNNALQILWYHTNGRSDTNSGWWATPLPSEIWAKSDPSKNADFDIFPLITSQP